jgi:hypothetical protein
MLRVNRNKSLVGNARTRNPAGKPNCYVRSWHIADYFSRPPNVSFEGRRTRRRFPFHGFLPAGDNAHPSRCGFANAFSRMKMLGIALEALMPVARDLMALGAPAGAAAPGISPSLATCPGPSLSFSPSCRGPHKPFNQGCGATTPQLPGGCRSALKRARRHCRRQTRITLISAQKYLHKRKSPQRCGGAISA